MTISSVPNLFILGAPKCGTTALCKWIGVHPSVFSPPTKEPHYFSTEYCLTPGREAYEKLFVDWNRKQSWAIDASVWSLYSPTAVPNILKARPDARFIVMLRNPLHMIPSMHRQQLYNGNELETNLRAALDLSNRRAAGENLSVVKGYPPDHLAYYRSCALGWQVERLLSLVAIDRVHFIVLDEIRKSPESVLEKVYDFLGIDPLMPKSFQPVNAAKVRPFPALDRVVKALGDWKHRQGITFRFGVLSWLRSVNQKEQSTSKVDDATGRGIRESMKEDVDLLGYCVGRDFSGWLEKSDRVT